MISTADPPPQRSWFAQHRFWTAVLVLLVVGAVGSLFGGPGDPSTDDEAIPTAADTFTTTAVPASPTPPAAHYAQRRGRQSSLSRHRRTRDPRLQTKRHKPTAVHRTAPSSKPVPGVPARDLPRPALTPGVVLTTSATRVCVPGYSTRVRNVPSAELEQAYARYGVAHIAYKHEVDHLISLELGGSNDIANLWPEPYAGRWGARTKDVLENKLHELVCSGALRLVRAQRIEATNWVAAYKKYVAAPPATRPIYRPPAGRARPRHAPAGSGGCTPGYAPCLPVVSDVNCDDLPANKTPVRVTGSDPYALDADGDGLGCES